MYGVSNGGKAMVPAFGYLRTSSATNVGEDKDSDKRQRAAIESAAASAGYFIKDWFYDTGVKGNIPVQDRPAFMEMRDALASNGVRHVFIEDIGRLSRDQSIGLLGIALIKRLGVTMIDGRGTDVTDPSDPMAKAWIGMMLVFAELEKDMLVKKLKGARDRKSAIAGRRIEGQKGYLRPRKGEIGLPLVTLAQSLAGDRTLLAISTMLAEQGHMTALGKAFSASQVKRLIEVKNV
jgi:DNA invertase Pin-like site-specific DNA recombinase